MSENILKFKIRSNDTLSDLEEYNRCISIGADEIQFFVPSRFEKKLFQPTRVCALIATACLNNKQTTLTDWSEYLDNRSLNDHFSDSLIGITSACHASRIENSKHQILEFDRNNFIQTLALQKMGLIDNSGSNNDFIFLSFDSPDRKLDFPRPIALSANNPQDFTNQFLRIKREKIDNAFGIFNDTQRALFGEYDIYEREKDLAALVYELYENTSQHGNKDENNKIIPGVRALSIKRHIINRYEEIEKQAEDFNEMKSYFKEISRKKKNKEIMFYEISVTDNGIGIIKRFQASRPDFKHDASFVRLSEFEKLNRIIEESLSSKLFSGAGKGIKIALKNIVKLNGFISLRTNNIWAYFDGTSRVSKITPAFLPVKTHAVLENTRGTSYSIIIPLSPK